MILGKIVHELLEYEGQEKQPSIESIIKKHLPPEDLIMGNTVNGIIQEVKTMANLIDKYPLSFNVVEREKEFFIPLDGNIIHGFIDGITDNNEILEHKTSSVKYDLARVHESPQSRIYSMAFRQIKGILPTKIIYDVLYKSKIGIRDLISTNFTEQELQQTKEWMLGLINMIKAQQFTPYKSVGFLHRGWCDHKNLCKYCR